MAPDDGLSDDILKGKLSIGRASACVEYGGELWATIDACWIYIRIMTCSEIAYLVKCCGLWKEIHPSYF